ncbi:MAG: hypothetical protein M1359_08550 [Betaproteobacteria bacterium]|nr:hypothetical protein [Betaproteobacteria bacterium]
MVVNNSTAGNIIVGNTTAAAGTVTATNSHQGGTIGIKGAGALTATANDGAITFTNGTSVTAIASQAVSLATRDANDAAAAAANTANTAATANTDASGLAWVAAVGRVTALTTLATAITTADSVSASQTAANSIGLATTTALGAGAITFAEKTAIDAAFATGLVTSAAAARAAAQALVTPLQTAATAAQAAATAADVINDANEAAALAAAQAVVNADNTKADGVDVIATTNTALTSVTVKGNYDNNAANSNTIADGSTLRNTLTTVTLENAGKSQITGQAVTNVSATGMNQDVTVVNTTANHTANFTLSGITAGTYTPGAGATTVNIASTGAATNVLTGLTANGATAINLTGTAGLTFGTLNAAANAVIDASANSGTNTITVAAGQKYVGGSGVDVVTTGNALQTAIVDGGAGSADRLILAHNVNFDGTGAAKFLNFEVLQANNGTTVDLTRFTGSTFTSLILSGNATVSGLNAAQAGAISIAGGKQALNIGVAGAATVGQIDTVSITNNTADATLTAPTLTGVEILNIASGKNLTIDSLLNATTALTNINLTGAGTVSITSEALALNVNSVVDASAATGAVTLNFSAGTGNGIALRGGSGNDVLTGSNVADRGNQLSGGAGNNTITGGQAADVITAGHGNNTITGSGGNDSITVGNGNNNITTTGGNDTIVAGNGINVIVAGAGNDTITVGTGYNLITGGAGRDVITFGANAAGVINGLVYTAVGETFTSVTAIASGATLATADVITGFGAGDTIDLTALTTNAFTAGALGSALLTASTGTIALVRGNFDAATNVFTASATGTSSLLNWDDNGTATGGNFEAIVLVGFAGTGSTTADGLITLA